MNEKTVLVVDDEPNVGRLLEMALSKDGYRVDKAANGRDALLHLDDGKPDLVILDIMMPYVDGLEVLKVIRESPDTRDVPVILLTARSQDADMAQGWAAGTDCYLTKPTDPAEIVAVVNRLLADRGAGEVSPTP